MATCGSEGHWHIFYVSSTNEPLSMKLDQGPSCSNIHKANHRLTQKKKNQ